MKHVRLMEVEREFLEAFSVIIQSSYFIEEEDFMALIGTLNVSYQSDHVVERARLLEFFTTAADLLGFDKKKVGDIIQDPWNREAQCYTNTQRQTRHRTSVDSDNDTVCDFYGQVDELHNESLYSVT